MFARQHSLRIAQELTEYVSSGQWEVYARTPEILKSITTKDILDSIKKNFEENNLTIGYFVGKTSMKYHINKSENYSLATIIPKQTPTVSALITVDVHDERTVADQSAQLMYGDTILSGTENTQERNF